MPRSSSGVARFGQHLARRRDLLGLTVEETAERAGLTVREIRAIETGARFRDVRRTTRVLARVSDALGVPAHPVTLYLRADSPDIFDSVVAQRRGGGRYGGPARPRRDGFGAEGRSVTRAHGLRATARQGGNHTPTHPTPAERAA